MAAAADKIVLFLILAAVLAVEAGESFKIRPPTSAAAAGKRFNANVVLSLNLILKLGGFYL